MSDIGRDAFKQFYDISKHLTTINTGAIVILATFFSKSFIVTFANWLVIVCVIAILLSLIFCVVGMVSETVSMTMTNPQHYTIKQFEKVTSITVVIFIISFICFVFGIMSLGAFVIVNIAA